jgi:hypothetical protein
MRIKKLGTSEMKTGVMTRKSCIFYLKMKEDSHSAMK